MQKYHGLLVVDKPGGMTSRAVVNRAQTWFARGTRVGHMGTLDPLATGVLVLGIGEGTRLTELVQDMDKVYRAGILLGATSDTDDADGIVTPTPSPSIPSPERLREELANWIGAIDQVPPDYSAVKVSGRRAYDLSRRGAKVDLASRKARIDSLEVVAYAYPHFELEVRCGKGTYIRSLARDLGERLGCGGLITSLRRLCIGPFTPALAISLDALAAEVHGRLLPLSLAVSQLPPLEVGADEILRLRQGQSIPRRALGDGKHALLTPAGIVVGIGQVEADRVQPVRMLNVSPS
jgi:tRNA pseudouridine55 synthase